MSIENKVAFKACLLGLPNVGKSLTFNVLSNMHKALSQNYPFCTIEPNKSIIPYRDLRLYELQKLHKSQTIIPELVSFVDIAGLVEGASQGEGLGNKFLSDIYQMDCIVHVLRCFEDDNILHSYDDINPERDLEIILKELRDKDLEMLKSCRTAKSHKDKQDLINRAEKALKDGEQITIEDKSIHLLSFKPFVILCNGPSDSIHTKHMKQLCEKKNWHFINFDLSELQGGINTDKNDLYIQQLINICRKSLNMITFFTAGPKEVHAWSIYKGTNIREAGGEIHSDLRDKFIRGKVILYGSTIEKTVDANYILEDGCQINIMHR